MPIASIPFIFMLPFMNDEDMKLFSCDPKALLVLFILMPLFILFRLSIPAILFMSRLFMSDWGMKLFICDICDDPKELLEGFVILLN